MSSFTPPATLVTNASGAYYIVGTQEYKRYSSHASDSATNVYYTLYNSTNTPAAQHAIYFDTGTMQWVDGSTGASEWPSVIVQSSTLSNGNSVQLQKTDGTVIYKFDMEGISTGSNTPLGTFVPDAKIVNHGGVTGFRFEQRGYPAASYELVGNGGPYTWTLTTQSNILQHHIGPLTPGTYNLFQDGSQVASIVAAARTKVHCNFW